MDGSVVNVALPAIAQSLNADARALQWVINSYLLPLSALLLKHRSRRIIAAVAAGIDHSFAHCRRVSRRICPKSAAFRSAGSKSGRGAMI